MRWYFHWSRNDSVYAFSDFDLDAFSLHNVYDEARKQVKSGRLVDNMKGYVLPKQNRDIWSDGSCVEPTGKPYVNRSSAWVRDAENKLRYQRNDAECW